MRTGLTIELLKSNFKEVEEKYRGTLKMKEDPKESIFFDCKSDGPEKIKVLEAIRFFEDKIKKQGLEINSKDKKYLNSLKDLYKEMKGDQP